MLILDGVILPIAYSNDSARAQSVGDAEARLPLRIVVVVRSTRTTHTSKQKSTVYGGRWCDSRCFPCCLIGCVCEIRLVSRIIRDWVRTRPTKSRIDAIETFAWRCLYVPPQAHVERDFAGSAEIIL